MGKIKDLTGKRFGKITVLKYANFKNPRGYCLWVCKCDCGRKMLRSTHDLMESLHSKGVYSCGECSSPNSITGIKGISIKPNGKFYGHVRYNKKLYSMPPREKINQALEDRNIAQAHVDYGDFEEWYNNYKTENKNKKDGIEIQKEDNETELEFIIRARNNGVTFQAISNIIGKSKQWASFVYNREMKKGGVK